MLTAYRTIRPNTSRQATAKPFPATLRCWKKMEDSVIASSNAVDRISDYDRVTGPSLSFAVFINTNS